jgi:glutathione S-transferase
MSKVEIIGIPQSTYVRVIRMACEEKGIDYALSPAPPHSPDVDAIHPFGKVPVMRHGNIALCESKAIATYLDRVFEGPKLIPDHPETAAVVEQWVSLVNTVIDQTLVRTYLFAYIFPKGGDGKPDRGMIETVVPTLRQQMTILDGAVARTGYLAGNGYTLADINVMPILFYVRQFPEGGETLAANKNLAAYFERHSARPSFRNTTPPPPPPPREQSKPN